MDTILVIIGAIVAIICIVAIYYLLKLILGYVGFAVIGAVVFGVIGAVAAKFLFPANMIDITLYSAGAGVVYLLVYPVQPLHLPPTQLSWRVALIRRAIPVLRLYP